MIDQGRADALRYDLDGLAERYGWLSGRHTTGRTPGDGTGHAAPGPRLPGPIDLTVLDLTDTRDKSDLYRDGTYTWPEQAAEDPLRMGVLPTLSRWSMFVFGEMLDAGQETGRPADAPDVADECAYLAERLDWIAQQEWAEVLADQVGTLAGLLLRYAPTKHPERDEVRRHWDVPTGELLTTHEAADLVGVGVATIWQWKGRGLISYARDDDGNEVRNEFGARLLRGVDVIACAARRRRVA